MADKNIYTVVVADDEDELREAVCTMIPWEALGFHLVGSASNGLDALELVEQLEPDLLLTDIRMPFISGIELARQVREIRPAMHIAFLSGYRRFRVCQAGHPVQHHQLHAQAADHGRPGRRAEGHPREASTHQLCRAAPRLTSCPCGSRSRFIIPLVLARYDNTPDAIWRRACAPRQRDLRPAARHR